MAGSSKICQGLQEQNGNNTGYIKAKWEKELNRNIRGGQAFYVVGTAFICEIKKVVNICLEKSY